jgi:hypothetical protein
LWREIVSLHNTGGVDVTWTRKRLRKEGPPLTETGRRLGFSKNTVVGMPGEPPFGASSDTEFAIGNSRKVRRRGGLICRAVAHGILAATLFWTLPVQPADDVTDLLVQVKKQLEQSQRQMEQSKRQLEQSKRQLEQSQKEITALKQQVEVLTKRVEQTPVAPAPGMVPVPDAKDVVVMQQPARNRSRRGGSHRVEENARIRRGNDAVVRVCIIGFGLTIAAIVPGG